MPFVFGHTNLQDSFHDDTVLAFDGKKPRDVSDRNFYDASTSAGILNIPNIYFTRNSIATYTGSDGLLKTAAVDEPRIQHDEAGNALGYLVENQVANYIPYSDFSSGWTSAAGLNAVDYTGVTAPDGTTSGIKQLNGFNASQGNRYYESVFLSPTTVTGSVWMRGVGSDIGKKVKLILKRNGGAYIEGNSVVTLTDKWQRVEASFEMIPENTGAILTFDTGSLAYAASSPLIWGPQIEIGSRATSYIPTSGSSAIRKADVLIKNTAQRKNLLPYSEDFVNPQWLKSNSSIISDAIASPGAGKADKLIASNSDSSHPIYRAITTIPSKKYTFSCFLKKSEIQYGRIAVDNNGTTSLIACNLNNGTIINQLGNVSVESAKNGFYRLSVTVTANNTHNTIYIEPCNSSGNATFTGNGANGIYIWGAQFEEGDKATEYDPSINLIQFPEQLDNEAWIKVGCFIVTNNALSPDGTQNADKIIEGFGTNNFTHSYRNVSIIGATKYTCSFYAKAGERNWCRFSSGNSPFGAGDYLTDRSVYFDLSNGVVGTIGSTFNSATIESVGGGWYRCSATGTTSGTSLTNYVLHYDIGVAQNDLIGNYAGDGSSGIYIWGAQLESGSTATPYNSPNYDTFINGGFISIDSDFTLRKGGQFFFDTDQSERNYLWNDGATNVVAGSSAFTTILNNEISDSRLKSAWVFAHEDMRVFYNGNSIYNNTSKAFSTPKNIYIGSKYNKGSSLNGIVKSFRYGSRQPSNNELEEMTGFKENLKDLGSFSLSIKTEIANEAFQFQCENNGTFNATIDWGDGTTSVVTEYNDSNLSHTYKTAGEYLIRVSGSIPNVKYNPNVNPKITAIFGGSQKFKRLIFRDSLDLEFIGDVDTSEILYFQTIFYNCPKLKKIPEIDTSNGLDFYAAFALNGELNEFPLINTSKATSLHDAWANCPKLESFPAIDTKNVIQFRGAWYNNRALTSFPLLDTSKGLYFPATWANCINLTDFPANMFDNCLATDFVYGFVGSGLSQQSVDNILISIDTAGQSNGTLNMHGGTNSTPSSAGLAAKASLESRGWTVTTN